MREEVEIENWGFCWLIDLMTWMILKDEVLVNWCVSVYCVELRVVCEYVVWDDVLTIFFLSFSFLFYGNSEFFLFDFWLFCKSKRVFFWGKTRDSENTVLNIFFRFRSGGDLIDHRSVSGGQRQKGAKMNAVILFSFLFFVEAETFSQR